jgi:hypothetical protein
VLRRKNRLTIEKELGGERLAVMQPIVRTCGALKGNVSEYVKLVLRALAAENTALGTLTPAAMVQFHHRLKLTNDTEL